MIDPIPTGLELMQEFRDHCMRHESRLFGLQKALHSKNLTFNIHRPRTLDQDFHIMQSFNSSPITTPDELLANNVVADFVRSPG